MLITDWPLTLLFTAWFIIGAIGAFLFILIQLVLLVDFAHSLNETWVDKMESENSRGWYAGRWSCSSSLTVSSQSECLKVIVFVFYSALLVVTVLLYVLSFTAVVLFFVFYTKPDGCSINKFFIGSNMLFSITASVISVLPIVQVRFDYCQGLSFSEGSLCWTPVCVFVCLQESQPRSGLLQSSVITLYTMFLTWSAMTNEPGESVCCCWFEVTWTVKFWRAEPML